MDTAYLIFWNKYSMIKQNEVISGRWNGSEKDVNLFTQVTPESFYEFAWHARAQGIFVT